MYVVVSSRLTIRDRQTVSIKKGRVTGNFESGFLGMKGGFSSLMLCFDIRDKTKVSTNKTVEMEVPLHTPGFAKYQGT